jgi:hypothetical protein
VISYRILIGPDIAPVLMLMAERDIPLPNINLMPPVAWVAEEDGKIIDMCILQAVPIVEIAGQTGETIQQLLTMAEKFIRETSPPRVLMHSNHRAMKTILRVKGADESPDAWFEWKSPVTEEVEV